MHGELPAGWIQEPVPNYPTKLRWWRSAVHKAESMKPLVVQGYLSKARCPKLLIILQPRDDSLLTVCWLEHDVYEKLPIMPKSASDITKKIYKSARRSCASTPRPFAAVGAGTVSGLVGCGVASVWKSGSL